jgi:hypothetical protein
LAKHRAERQPINWRIMRVHYAYKTLRLRNAIRTILWKLAR